MCFLCLSVRHLIKTDRSLCLHLSLFGEQLVVINCPKCLEVLITTGADVGQEINHELWNTDTWIAANIRFFLKGCAMPTWVVFLTVARSGLSELIVSGDFLFSTIDTSEAKWVVIGWMRTVIFRLTELLDIFFDGLNILLIVYLFVLF